MAQATNLLKGLAYKIKWVIKVGLLHLPLGILFHSLPASVLLWLFTSLSLLIIFIN